MSDNTEIKQRKNVLMLWTNSALVTRLETYIPINQVEQKDILIWQKVQNGQLSNVARLCYTFIWRLYGKNYTSLEVKDMTKSEIQNKRQMEISPPNIKTRN